MLRCRAFESGKMDTLKPYSYLLINLLSIAGPIALSFDKKVRYYTYWPKLIPGMFTTAMVFIIWDILFTQWGVWSFNSDYLTGLKIVNLPIEECLFFFTIPFSCMFLYVIFRTRFGEANSQDSNRTFIFISLIFIVIGLISAPKLYTSVTSFAAALVTLVHYRIFKHRWLKIFAITYLIHLIPFFAVNGILTAIPIVLYNDLENSGIRLYSIPIEDSMYSYVLLLMNVTGLELMIDRQNQ